MALTYCMGCKQMTANKNPHLVPPRQVLSTCATCGRQKSIFTSVANAHKIQSGGLLGIPGTPSCSIC